jgi:hypothetical protein
VNSSTLKYFFQIEFLPTSKTAKIRFGNKSAFLIKASRFFANKFDQYLRFLA